MKLIILTIIIALCWIPFSYGDVCNCACCATAPNCALVTRLTVDVADCSSCTITLCKSKYPTQCPMTNSQVNSTCNSFITSESSEPQQQIVSVLVLLLISISNIYCSSLF